MGIVRNLATLLLFTLLLLASSPWPSDNAVISRESMYAVASILFMHYAINVGMVLGLAPVIGIPLPSSALEDLPDRFTLLVFILLRLDAERFTVCVNRYIYCFIEE